MGRKEVRTGVVDPGKRSTVKTLISREDTAKAVTCVVVAAERATD